MKLCISNFGYYTRGVEDDYIPIDGEVLFDAWPSEAELIAAFPGRLEYQEQLATQQLALEMRAERDRLMRVNYDAGTQMVRRELEMTNDPSYTAQLIDKRTELHLYAIALQGVPEQTGFPHTITWPTVPSETLE